MFEIKIAGGKKNDQNDKNNTKKDKKKRNITGLSNILAEITINQPNLRVEEDESLHFNDLKAKLVKVYGPPSTKSMQIIDSIYNFGRASYDQGSSKNNHKGSQKFYHGSTNSKTEIEEIVSKNFRKKKCHNSSTRVL